MDLITVECATCERKFTVETFSDGEYRGAHYYNPTRTWHCNECWERWKGNKKV